MKIAVDCQSPLLQKSLEIFLDKNISTVKQCDIIIRDKKDLDNKKCFFISSDKEADLIKPFSYSQLIEALEDRYESMSFNEMVDMPLEFSILEQRIESLTKEYQQNILKVVRAFYEK